MKKLVLILLILSLNSCGILIWRKIECRPYKLDFEQFWIQGDIGISGVNLVDNNNSQKTFIMKDKWIFHREFYFSDTGCNCTDGSAQLLCSKSDTLWMTTEGNYIERKRATYNESVNIVTNGDRSTFTKNDLTLGKEIISSDTILTREYSSDTISSGVYSITFAKGIGPIRIKYKNGDTYNLLNPIVKPISPISTYRNVTTECY
jgi:hypothetical protein